jgi:hypothetical protein
MLIQSNSRMSPNSAVLGEEMKKFALAVALVVTALSLAGCFVGKGKAPPPFEPPIVTKG